MRNIILYLSFAALLFTACEKIGLQENGNDITYLSFVKDYTQDSAFVSFMLYEKDEITFPVELKINGRVPTEDLEFRFSVVTDSTTLDAACYVLPEKYVYPAGKLTDTVYVQFSNAPELKEQIYRLWLSIDGMGHFEEGPRVNRMLKMIVCDRLNRPEFWKELPEDEVDVIGWYYLGEYSDKKYELLLEVNDFVDFGAASWAERRFMALKLKRYIEQYNAEHPNDLLRDENGKLITVPIAG